MPSFFPLAAFAALAVLASSPTAGASDGLVDALANAAPNADRRVLQLAANALACVRARNPASAPQTLSVIDYSKPSTQRRLWVFDLSAATLLYEELVAHGRNSGGNRAEHFSNDAGSLMSSVGVFVTGETYTGRNGYSLRLRGLEAGFNDQASARAIVMHGADYVSEGIIRSQGRLGRSLGCPAVPREVAVPLIDTIRNGSIVFAYFPLAEWLRDSSYIDGCLDGNAGSTPQLSP